MLFHFLENLEKFLHTKESIMVTYKHMILPKHSAPSSMSPFSVPCFVTYRFVTQYCIVSIFSYQILSFLKYSLCWLVFIRYHNFILYFYFLFSVFSIYTVCILIAESLSFLQM